MQQVKPLQSFNSVSQQRGASGLAMFILIMLLILLAITGFKLFASYYDDFAVKTALENMQEKTDGLASMSAKKILDDLNKRTSVSGVSLTKDDLIVEKNKTQTNIKVEYERRTHLYFNIDAVTVFKHSITVAK